MAGRRDNLPICRDPNLDDGLDFLRNVESIIDPEFRPCGFCPEFNEVIVSGICVSGKEPADLDAVLAMDTADDSYTDWLGPRVSTDIEEQPIPQVHVEDDMYSQTRICAPLPGRPLIRLGELPMVRVPISADRTAGGCGSDRRTQIPMLTGESRLEYLKRNQPSSAIQNALPHFGLHEMKSHQWENKDAAVSSIDPATCVHTPSYNIPDPPPVSLRGKRHPLLCAE